MSRPVTISEAAAAAVNGYGTPEPDAWHWRCGNLECVSALPHNPYVVVCSSGYMRPPEIDAKISGPKP